MKRKTPKIPPVLLFFTVLLWGYCPAAIIYVDGHAAGGGDGKSWATALGYLQDALAVAQPGDEIYVAAGTYYPDRSTAAPGGSGDRNAAFVLVDAVALRGGYAGVGATDPNDRDFGAFESVLCGDFDDNDVILATPADLFGDSTRDENSLYVVIASGVDEETVLEGFTIRGGSSWHSQSIPGGGMLIESAAPTVINCRFVYNVGETGGGMHNTDSNPLVINCMFIGNWAYDSGGGVYDGSADAVFMNCLFSGNRAEDWAGGGVFHDSGEATFINCTFSGNWASDGGGGLYVNAGNADISNCIIYEEISLSGGTVSVRYSNVPEGLGGENDVHADPLFVDADGEDDIFGTVDDNVRLLVDSPCINAGDPMRRTDPNETDLDGRRRINDGAVDMGAYEFFVTPALVGHWKLDEAVGAIAYDSVEANDGSLAGDPVWMPFDGRVDGSLAFDGGDDGDGDYVNCGNSGVFDIRNEITLSAWIKVDEFTDSWRPIITKGDNAWRLQSARIDNPGTLEFACTGLLVPYTQWGNVLGNIRIDDGLWHHVAGVYDDAKISLYIDGVLDVTSVASGQININDYDVLIGSNAQKPDRFFNGLIDDVGVYNYALSPEQIAALANPSTVFHVDGVGGNDLNDGLSRDTAFATINMGIIQAVEDDTVLVWPGVYNEQVYFQGKRITVRSAADSAVVQTPVGYAFSFQDGEGPDSVLSNFIIRDSYRAIYCFAGSPTIKNMTIVNNNFGIRALGGADPDISNCIFWNNAQGNTEGCESRHSWDWEPVEAAAHWKFDETGGTTVYDAVGFSHGTIYGPVRVEGQVAGALHFDGNGDYALVADSPAISVGTGNYTISAWIKPELTNYIHVILSKISSRTDKEYIFSIDRDRIRLDIEKGDNNGRAYSTEAVSPQTWQHVAVTFDAAALAPVFYYNGAALGQVTSGSPITILPDSLNANLMIGMRAAPYEDREFMGEIDEIMIFNRVLSAEEMQVVYKSQLSVLFADAENNDFHLLSEKGRFVPLDPVVNNGLEGLWTFDGVTSPCVDGGDPAERPYRERMPNGGRVNLGAYGNTLYASMSEWPIEGDINRDGVVNLADLALMAGQWLIALPWAAGG